MRSPFRSEIAGLYYRRNNLTSGKFPCYIRKEPSNPHDPEAVGIYLENGTLVGYIPRENQYYLKAWNPNFNYLKGNVSLQIEKEWDRYYGEVSISSHDDYSEPNPLRGKKVYVCKNMSLNREDPFIEIGASFGVIYNSQLKLDTDFVVYQDNLPQVVLEKQQNEKYHFQILTIADFIKMGLDPEKCDSRFYGKRIYSKGLYIDRYSRFIFDYILENGGTLTDRFSKKCDVALKFEEEFAPTIKERIANYNMPIVSASSILKKATYVPSPPVSQKPVSKPVSKNDESKDNSKDGWKLLLLILWFAGVLLLLSYLIGA